MVPGATEPLAIGERCKGPIFIAPDGRRLDRHGAGRIVRRIARRAGITKPVGPHTLRHAFITAAQMSGVASDASLPGKRDHGAVRERESSSPVPAPGRQSETAGQAGRDVTMLQRLPRCRIQFGCIARQNDAVTATPKPHQRGRALPKARYSR